MVHEEEREREEVAGTSPSTFDVFRCKKGREEKRGVEEGGGGNFLRDFRCLMMVMATGHRSPPPSASPTVGLTL